jgi:MFS superfamily sulfate permease-like transporter
VNAICFSVVILQGPSMLGLKSDPNREHNYVQNIYFFLQQLGNTHTPTLIVTIITLAFLFGFAFFKKMYPDNKIAKFFPA